MRACSLVCYECAHLTAVSNYLGDQDRRRKREFILLVYAYNRHVLCFACPLSSLPLSEHELTSCESPAVSCNESCVSAVSVHCLCGCCWDNPESEWDSLAQSSVRDATPATDRTSCCVQRAPKSR